MCANPLICESQGFEQDKCAECGQDFVPFPAPREYLGAWVCSGSCAVWRRRRIVGYTAEDGIGR